MINNTEFYNRIVKGIVDGVQEEAVDRPTLDEFNDLSKISQEQVAKRIIKACTTVFVDNVKEMKSFRLPYVGTIKIKDGKALEIQLVTELANANGFELDDLTDEQYEAYRLKIKSKVSNTYIKKRRARFIHKVKQDKARVLKLNLKTFKIA